MKVTRWAVGLGLAGLVLGCARREQPPGADTTAMAPAVPGPTEMVVEVRELSPGLLVEARFRPADAQRVALTRFPNGTVIEASIERRSGELVYDYRVRDEQGRMHMVRINANTGIIIEVVPDTGSAYRPSAAPGAPGTAAPDRTVTVTPVAQPSQPESPQVMRTRVAAAPPREHVVKIIEERPGLIDEARVKPLDAQHVAQTRFPEGEVEAGKIERRPQGLVYIFVIKDEGKRWEVLVDAFDADLIGINPKSGVLR
ncbi:MAG: PepSY domain-containing protein [Gemmatimonadales bacterium]